MDKIWYRNPSRSEVIGCCGGDDPAEPAKVERSKNKNTQPPPPHLIKEVRGKKYENLF